MNKQMNTKSIWSRLIRRLDSYRLLFWMPNVIYEKIVFQANTGGQLNLRNPVNFNDKIIWLKSFWFDEGAKKCANKYDVRQYLEENKLHHLLNELYCIYDDADDISFPALPDSFIMKVTTGSGWNILCRDKSQLNWEQELKKLRKWTHTDYFRLHREWVYKKIKPKIIVEKLLLHETGEIPMDFKVMCTYGKPFLIQVDIDRFGNHRRNFYSTDWTFQNTRYGIDSDINANIEKPDCIDEMLHYSEFLSKDFPFVRIDFYIIHDKLFFGELTFFPCAGYTCFEPVEYSNMIGGFINIDGVQKQRKLYS